MIEGFIHFSFFIHYSSRVFIFDFENKIYFCCLDAVNAEYIFICFTTLLFLEPNEIYMPIKK